MKICVFAASSDAVNEKYGSACRALGRELAARGHTLVFGAGNHGLMLALAQGAEEVGGRIIGVAPAYFQTGDVLFPRCTELLVTETMRERKQRMEELADAFLMVPGGIGTMDEFFEVLTLRQVGRHRKPIGIYSIGGYFDALLTMLACMSREGFADESLQALYLASDQATVLLEQLEQKI